MEIIITLIALIIIWCVAFMVGAKQGANRTINQIKKDGGYYDLEYTSSAYPILYPTSSLDEVPKEFLMGGDIDRALHIAGVKEATPAKIAEWDNERKIKAEAKQEASVDDLISKLNKTDLQIKAGLIENTDKTGVDIKIEVKEIDPIIDNKKIMEAAIKENDREREQRIKIDFDALNFSRISNEARKQITEIVKKDIENKMKVVEENSPEIVEDKKIAPCVGHELESQKENDKLDADFMHNWIQEKSGKKKPNPKQMNGIESDKPFVKTRKKKQK